MLFIDTLVRSGQSPDGRPPRLPYIPGNGVAGHAGGRPVVARTGGSYSERVVAPAERLVPAPDAVEVAAGRLRPVIDRVLPLERAADAHAAIAARAVIGRILLTP